jgi:hypothetical protein
MAQKSILIMIVKVLQIEIGATNKKSKFIATGFEVIEPNIIQTEISKVIRTMIFTTTF